MGGGGSAKCKCSGAQVRVELEKKAQTAAAMSMYGRVTSGSFVHGVYERVKGGAFASTFSGSTAVVFRSASISLSAARRCVCRTGYPSTRTAFATHGEACGLEGVAKIPTRACRPARA